MSINEKRLQKLIVRAKISPRRENLNMLCGLPTISRTDARIKKKEIEKKEVNERRHQRYALT